MNVLVSTEETQGQRENDFCFVPEGEMVCLSWICGHDKHDVDGSCGCGRSFVGIICRKGTTTAKAVHYDGTKEEWEEEIRQSFLRAGYKKGFDNQALWDVAQQCPEGTIFERRENCIQSRDEE